MNTNDLVLDVLYGRRTVASRPAPMSPSPMQPVMQTTTQAVGMYVGVSAGLIAIDAIMGLR